jgi:hypothetical protein
MYQPAYYLGRRIHVFRPDSHPAVYVYTYVRQQVTSAPGLKGSHTSRKARLRLAHVESRLLLPRAGSAL